MTMIYDPIPFVKLVRKCLVGNYEPIMGICGKLFIINLHNLQMLFMLWIKNTFLECLAPLHKHEDPQWKTFRRRSAQARRHGGAFGGSYPQIFFVSSKILLCSKKFVLNMIQQKSLPSKNVFSPQTLKPWLRAWFCQNCICN